MKDLVSISKNRNKVRYIDINRVRHYELVARLPTRVDSGSPLNANISISCRSASGRIRDVHRSLEEITVPGEDAESDLPTNILNGGVDCD